MSSLPCQDQYEPTGIGLDTTHLPMLCAEPNGDQSSIKYNNIYIYILYNVLYTYIFITTLFNYVYFVLFCMWKWYWSFLSQSDDRTTARCMKIAEVQKLCLPQGAFWEERFDVCTKPKDENNVGGFCPVFPARQVPQSRWHMAMWRRIWRSRDHLRSFESIFKQKTWLSSKWLQYTSARLRLRASDCPFSKMLSRLHFFCLYYSVCYVPLLIVVCYSKAGKRCQRPLECLDAPELFGCLPLQPCIPPISASQRWETR